MSALMDGISPVMASDSLQIIPVPWDTTTNHLVPTTSFSTFFMFRPLPSIRIHEHIKHKVL